MHKHYIINRVVEFHPATGTLREISRPDHVVMLNSPAGRCLLLLIERFGNIVTQQEFLEIVWKQRGMLVSSSAYYQNISILRKGLKKIGFEVDPIVTIPRIGLTLASDVEIDILEEQSKPETTEAELSVSPIGFHSSTSIGKKEEDSVADSINNRRKISFTLHAYWLSIMLFSLSILSGIGLIIYSNAKDEQFSDSYMFAASSGKCRVYLSSDIQTQAGRGKALTYVPQFADDCSTYPWVYVATYDMLPRVSVIRCDRPMTQKNQCISDYFIQAR